MFMQILNTEGTHTIATYPIRAMEAARAAYVGHSYFFSIEKTVTQVQIRNAPLGVISATGALKD